MAVLSAPLCTGQLFLLLIRRSLDILCILCILYIFYILCILCTVSCTVSGLARLSLLCSRRRVLVRHHHGIRRPLLGGWLMIILASWKPLTRASFPYVKRGSSVTSRPNQYGISKALASSSLSNSTST